MRTSATIKLVKTVIRIFHFNVYMLFSFHLTPPNYSKEASRAMYYIPIKTTAALVVSWKKRSFGLRGKKNTNGGRRTNGRSFEAGANICLTASSSPLLANIWILAMSSTDMYWHILFNFPEKTRLYYGNQNLTQCCSNNIKKKFAVYKFWIGHVFCGKD